MSLKRLLSGSANGGLFSGRPSTPETIEVPANNLSDKEKLAMLDDLERTGLGWFWASDANGNLTYLSEAIAERIEFPIEALLGKPLAGVFEVVGGDGPKLIVSE